VKSSLKGFFGNQQISNTKLRIFVWNKFNVEIADLEAIKVKIDAEKP
jgi:hypothetical protein